MFDTYHSPASANSSMLMMVYLLLACPLNRDKVPTDALPCVGDRWDAQRTGSGLASLHWLGAQQPAAPRRACAGCKGQPGL